MVRKGCIEEVLFLKRRLPRYRTWGVGWVLLEGKKWNGVLSSRLGSSVGF